MAYRDSYDTPFGLGVPRTVTYLLIANAIVFILCQLPGVVPVLALRPVEAWREPWTLLTYMFAHRGGFHLLFNMIALFFFGRALEERWGGTEFLKFYLVAGLGGALLSFATPGANILGASAAVNGVMLAFAVIWPDAPIHLFGVLPVKAKWLVAFLAAFSLASAVGDAGGGVAHWAHLGGFAAGWAYLRLGFVRGEPTSAKGGRGGVLSSLTSRLKTTRKSATASVPTAGVNRQVRQLDEIDRILEKISAKGLKSLSADERQTLEDMSRRNPGETKRH